MRREKDNGERREEKEEKEREKEGESVQIYKLLCKLLNGIMRERERAPRLIIKPINSSRGTRDRRLESRG